MDSNKIFDCFIEKKNIYDNIPNEIIEKNTNYDTLDNMVLNHPFIDKLELIELEINYCILYRFNKFNKFYYLEYYIINVNNCCYNDILDEINYIKGIKKVKGTIQFKNNNYILIQVRGNSEIENWVVLWDIIITQSYFGLKYDRNIIDFFYTHNQLDNLFIKNNICLKPLVLYAYVDIMYKKYIKLQKSIQYCQNINSSLIELSNYKNDDNVRNLCFINDIDICKKNESDNYCIINNNWVFKNDKDILSLIK